MATAQSVFRKNFSILTRYLRSVGLKYKVTSGKRSTKKQAALYGSQNAYPVAPPGTSQHEYGLAKDMVVSPASYQSFAGQTWKKMGLWWDPSDPVHFAAYDPQTWSQILGAAEQIPTGGFLPFGGQNILPILPKTVPLSVGGSRAAGISSASSAVSNARVVVSALASTSVVPTSAGRPTVPIATTMVGSIGAPVSTSVVPGSTARP